MPLQERAENGGNDALVRLTLADFLVPLSEIAPALAPIPMAPGKLIPEKQLREGEQYRFHFNMNKCIGCRSCEVACNEQNANPTDIRWRRIGEIEGGVYPDTSRHYLSMGCNHCLDAECVKGCPVEAYTKDAVTGIVLHSTTACIGCQYCVWNCPYSVPQFNVERGVVGKCDMCHGRLTDGREPACVNACPEAAIEIEIVDMLEWRSDYALAESPGMPEAGHTISTTRITLPPDNVARLERVDTGRIQLEHAHLSLVFMTTLMQAAVGSLIVALVMHTIRPAFMVAIFAITALALSISVIHLGRPAYAWRALRMWRRSWLSREVLMFGLFIGAIAILAFATCITTSHSGLRMMWNVMRMLSIQSLHAPDTAILIIGYIAGALGVGGIVSGAFIYLVPARPSWNMAHTPLDFLLSSAMIGTVFTMLFESVAASNNATGIFLRLCLISTMLWTVNHAIRLLRLYRSRIFELRASASLLGLSRQRMALMASFALGALTPLFAYAGNTMLACLVAFAAVLLGRYLFFVSVVPLNMALMFTSGGKH